MPPKNWFFLSLIDPANEHLVEMALNYIVNSSDSSELSRYVTLVFGNGLKKKELVEKLFKRITNPADVLENESVFVVFGTDPFEAFTNNLIKNNFEGDDEVALNVFKVALEKRDTLVFIALCLSKRQDNKWSIIHTITEKMRKNIKNGIDWKWALSELEAQMQSQKKPANCYELSKFILINMHK